MTGSAVDPKFYNRDYFLHDEYGGGDGEDFSKGIIIQRFKDAFDDSGVATGMKVLDIGCGRGEMVRYCAMNGAFATGIDYSKDAIELAVSAAAKLSPEVRNRINFLNIEGFSYTFESGSFDRIFLLDVAEHLSPSELAGCLKEAKRLLKRGGKVFIDTSPNRLFNDIAYPFWERPLNRLINIVFGTKLMTRNARTEYDKKVHINELTCFSLKKYLNNAGFTKIRIRMHPRKVIPRKMGTIKKQVLEWFRCVVTCFFPLSCFFPLNIVFSNDIIGEGE